MQNPISISCINNFIFFVFILLQCLLSVTLNYNDYRITKNKLDATLAGMCTFCFDADSVVKNKFITRSLLQNMLDWFEHHEKKY